MHKAGTLGLSCGCSEVFDRPHAGRSLGPHGDWVPMATAPPDRSRSCLSFPGWTWKPAQETAESLADHSAHLPTHGSVRRRSTQVCEVPPHPRPHNRGASHAGVLVWGSGDKPAATFIHLSVRQSRLFVVLGLRSPFPCRLSAESHAQLSKVTHTPGHLARLSPTALTMQQVPLQLSAPAFPPCGRLEKTP